MGPKARLPNRQRQGWAGQGNTQTETETETETVGSGLGDLGGERNAPSEVALTHRGLRRGFGVWGLGF